jgi:hypothetical protein
MMARRLTTIVPAMRLADALETRRIPRVAGRTGARTALVTTRPCRAPHHTIADVRLIGGQIPRPDDGSLAHHGMFLKATSRLPRLACLTSGGIEGAHLLAVLPPDWSGRYSHVHVDRYLSVVVGDVVGFSAASLISS